MKARKNIKTATIATVTLIALVALLVGPTAVLAKTDAHGGGGRSLSFTSELGSPEVVVDEPVKLQGETRAYEVLTEVTPRQATPVPETAAEVAATTVVRTPTSQTLDTSTPGGTTTEPAPTAPAPAAPAPTAPVVNELAQAQAILAGYISRYPILAGTTVSFGQTPGGYQAVSYYTVGRILISPTHTASLERIIGHEIWHIIDYRDNGQIDWGENVPPSNYP